MAEHSKVLKSKNINIYSSDCKKYFKIESNFGISFVRERLQIGHVGHTVTNYGTQTCLQAN